MRPFSRSLVLGGLLMLALMVCAACAPASAPATQTPTTAPPATQPAASQPTVGATSPQQQSSQDPGPSISKSPAAAETRHWKGNPDAPVVLIEISDFQ